MKWSDLDLIYGKLQVQRTLIRVKGGKVTVAEPKSPTSRRCIYLTHLAIEALKRHRQRHAARAHTIALGADSDKLVLWLRNL